jgi:hypothetical protein
MQTSEQSTAAQASAATPGRRGAQQIYAGVGGLLLVIAIAAAILVGAEYAVPIAILAVLVLGYLALGGGVARRDTQLAPDETALGDTAEAHAEISPHDVPVGAPNRRAVELAAARGERDTTRGNEFGAAGGRGLRHDEAPPSSDEELEDDRPAAA